MKNLANRVICLGLTLAASGALATTIDPLTWDQLLFEADFVGIVECTTAGEIVAGYTVVESWKGAPKDTTLTIRMATNYWGQQADIALVGERFLITAFESSPSRYNSVSAGGPVPMWWRNLPADLELPLFQGLRPLPIAESRRGILETEAKTLEEYKALAQAFLKLSPDKQESALLGSLARKYLTDRDYESEEADAKAVPVLLEQLSKLDSVALSVNALHAFGSAHPNSSLSYRVAVVLKQGGPLTQAALAKMTPDASTPQLDVPISRPPPAPLPKTEINRLRAELKSSKGSPRGHIVQGLTVADCGTMADFIANMGMGSENEFGLGSFVAFQCGSDRRKNLLRITKAKTPMFRVAAAVYLAMEDEPLGLAKLKELSALTGDEGAWAAITLSRYGEKDSVGRALKVFEREPREVTSDALHRQLQHRLCVLLSNSKVPVPTRCQWTAHALGDFEKWWAANADAVSLKDPWLDQLKKRKVD